MEVRAASSDIKGKVAGMPVYQLLGGASRTGLMAYGHASGKELPELFDSIREHQEEGYRSIRVQSGVPGLESIYGIASNKTTQGNEGVRYDFEPAQRGAFPAMEDWDTRAYLRHVPTVFEAVRNEFGPELPLLHDGHHRMTPLQAAKLVRQHTTTPLAIGEVFNTIWDFKNIIRDQLIDYVRGAVTHMGGISPLRKTMDYAAMYQIKSGFHGPTDISPVGLAAQMHLGLAIHNFGIQEYMQHGPKTNQVFRQTFTFTDGYLHPGDEPGLGVSLDVDEAGKYPYEQAYLPFNRLADGTVDDW